MSNALDHHHHHDPAPKVLFGFWIYLMTDAIMFAGLFATYSVLHNNTFGGPGIQQITSLHHVMLQTLIFLISAFTYGLGYVALHRGQKIRLKFWSLVTFFLGLAYLTVQYHEYRHVFQLGSDWTTSAFMSVYFTLTGIFATHVLVGMVWILILLLQLLMKGLTPTMRTRFTCLGLYWNYLTLIWIIIFTLIYLMGAV